MLAVREHPEYYAAYVGVGQISSSQRKEYDVQKDFLIQKAREAGDSSLLSALQADSAKIREDDLFRYEAELHESTSFWPLLLSGLQAPEYTFTDAMNVEKGVELVNHKMRYDVISGSLTDNVHKIDIPIFFFLGRYDYNTPSKLAAEYLDSIACPFKRLLWFERSAHFPFFEESERFDVEMVRVDSLAKSFWSAKNGPGQE